MGTSPSCALLGLFIAGCVAVPVSFGPAEAPLAGKRVKEEEVAAVAAVGKSRSEVVSSLGKPTMELREPRILVYPWIERKADWQILTVGGAGTVTAQEGWALLVAFDDDGHVTHAGLVTLKLSEAINTVARSWAEQRGIASWPPETAFVAASPPSGKALIYVLRTVPAVTLMTVLGAGSSWPLPVAVAIDGQYFSELDNQVYVAVTAEPGRHTLVADAVPPYRFVNAPHLPAALALDTRPNKVYFVELTCTSGTGSVDTTLTQKSEAEALAVVKDFRPAW